jgi:alkylation response protein AidB-like acyl-CoA dehydrogenase
MSKIVTLAENLRPLIVELRHNTEKERSIAAPIVQAIRKSDLCRMLFDTGESPQYTANEWLDVLETLAGAEASVSWFIWNSTLPCFWARFLDNAARDRIFGDTNRVLAGSTRPTGKAVVTKGGFQLSGHWSLVSGCELADYLHLMSPVHQDGASNTDRPDVRIFFLEKGRYNILDTWNVGGLRGSGSHDVVVDDVFVPVEDSIELSPPVASNSRLAQLPIVPIMIAGIGAQFLGMAREAITVTLEILRNKISLSPSPSIGERPCVLAEIASHNTAVTAARMQLHASMADMWDKAGREVPSATDRAALFSAGLYAAKVARSAVVDMHAAAGTPALYVDCPLERCMRDFQTMDRHVAAQPLWLEDSGRVLLGYEPVNPLFMI